MVKHLFCATQRFFALALLLFGLVTFTSAANDSVKVERYLKNFERYVDEVSPQVKTYTKAEWKEVDAMLEVYMNDNYELLKAAMNDDQKRRTNDLRGRAAALYVKRGTDAASKKLKEALGSVGGFVEELKK